MGIPKLMGVEQEYAITLKGRQNLSVFDAACMVVNAYARTIGLKDDSVDFIWDYGHETPYQDIRGTLFGKSTGQEIMGREENRRINTALPNGARLYTDHAHPEFSTPECLRARDAVAYDRAGENILQTGLTQVNRLLGRPIISLFKNNIDHQGHSFGTHENYLMDAGRHQELFADRSETAVRRLVPFLATRHIFAGAGKAAGGAAPSPYQISQRADFMEHIFGLETMYARPIINTRREHHADPDRFRRLHLILGDANMSEFAAFLKLGATQIVLQMLEAGFILDDLALADPLKAMKDASLRFDAMIEAADGKTLTALDVQRRYLELAEAFGGRGDAALIPEYDEILSCWAAALTGLEKLRLSADFMILDDPEDLAGRLDWVMKLWTMNRYRETRGATWDDPQLKVLDLQYHNIDPASGLFYRLQDQGRMQRLLTDEAVEKCVFAPPEDTRAYFRGRCIEKYPGEMYLVNWEVVGFDQGDCHRMVPLLNPLKATRSHVEHFFEAADSAARLLELIEQS